MKKDPSKKYRPFPPVDLPDRQWPGRVLTSKTRTVPRHRRLRIQGDRGRFPLRLANRIHLQPPSDRGGPRARRRLDASLGPSARRPDRTHARVAHGRPEGDHPHVQFDLAGAAPGGVRQVQGRDQRHRGARRHHGARTPRPPRRHRTDVAIFAGKLLRHRGGVRARSERGGDGRVGAHARTADDPQPARYRRSRHAQRLRRPDRVDLPQHQSLSR